MTSRLEFDARIQADLLAAAGNGNADAVAEIYDSTFEQIYSFALRITRNRQDAEDVTSETYERALRNLRSFRSGDVPISIWLIRIARNVAHKHLRDAMRQPTIALTPAMADQFAGRENTSVISASDLSAITPAQREVVALRLAGFKIREIAVALGKAEGTVKALQFAAARRLREEMRP